MPLAFIAAASLALCTPPIAQPGSLGALDLAALSSDAPAQALTLDLPGRGPTTLLLSRVQAPGTMINVEVARRTARGVQSRSVQVPAPAAWHGCVAGAPDARVYVGAGADGLVAGLIQITNDTWWIASPPRNAAGPALISHERAFEGFDLSGLRCHTDELAVTGDGEAGAGNGSTALTEPCREIRIAVETDTEFLANLFGGNITKASQYTTLLIGAMSEIYTRDVNARLPMTYLRLWDGPDVWTQDGSISAQLTQFRDYWNTSMGAVRRDDAHLLSGRNLGGGIAWLPGLCGSFAYAVSANLGGSFPYPLQDHSDANWDPMVVAHETGHNFGAPHTHDGYASPPDGCGTGDCSLAFQGTIMSYCHTCAGGMANISLAFHPMSIGSMSGHLNGVGCDYRGVGVQPYAMGDFATALGSDPLVIDALANDVGVNCDSVTIASASNVSAHGGTVSVLPPSGPNPAQLQFAAAAGYSGVDTFNYTIQDSTGSTAVAVVSVDVRAYLAASKVTGDAVGVRVSWFAIPESALLPDFTALSPYSANTVQAINVPSTGGNFSLSGRADLVAAAFDGWLNVPAGSGGLVQLFVESDDGSRVLIDGTVLVNNDGLHGMVERGGSIALRPGKHRLRTEFFENYGGAGLVLRWMLPGGAKVVVPNSAFTWGGTGYIADLDADGSVNGADLGILLGDWGQSGAPGTLRSDLDRNGVVDGADLGLLLAAWGG